LLLDLVVERAVAPSCPRVAKRHFGWWDATFHAGAIVGEAQVLVVVTSLEEIDPLVAHQTDDPAFLRETPRPRTWR